MAIPSKAVKSTAKAALKGRWLIACTSTIVFILPIIIISFATSLLSSILKDNIVFILWLLLNLFLVCPLFLGLIRFFKNLVFENVLGVQEIFIYFSCFKAYKRAMRLILDLLARFIFYSVVCFIPAGIVKLITSDFFFDLLNVDIPLWSESLGALLSFLIGMAALAIFVLMLRYYLAPFLLVANDDMSVDEAIHMASVIARRSSGELWSLIFSFLGYLLLSLFVVPIIFTLPYFLCALTVHARYSVTGYNLNLTQENTRNF